MQLRTKTLKETIDDLRAENAKLRLEIAALKKAAAPAPEAATADADVIKQYMAISSPIKRARFARDHNLVSTKE